jgi:hypothetical protein
MPRYFFHSQDGATVLDSTGLDLPSLDAAREEAIRSCGEMLLKVRHAIHDGDPFRLWVTDQAEGRGKKVFGLIVTVDGEYADPTC